MIYLNMDADFNPATVGGGGATSDLNGSVTIGGNAKIDMNTTAAGKYGHNTIVDSVHYMATQLGYPTLPPVFVSDLGGATYTDTKNLYVVPLPGYDDATSQYAATRGDYLSMYMYNLGVLLGFNEGTLSAEPSPATTSIEKITTRHGIN